MTRLLGAVMLLAAAGVAQAQPHPPTSPSKAPPPAAPAPAAAPAAAPEAGALTWTAPTEWESLPQRPMRVATYRIPAAKGDAEPAELAVFYFGPGQGGGVEDNVKRWLGQFRKADGTPVTDKDAKTKKDTFNNISVTTVDVKGTYTGGGPMMGPSAPKPGSRLLGAIAEGPEGPVFFKLTGFERTVANAEKPFRKLLSSVTAK